MKIQYSDLNANSQNAKINEIRFGTKTKEISEENKETNIHISTVNNNGKKKLDSKNKIKEKIIGTKDKGKGEENMSIIYLNARSMLNKMDELKELVNEHKPVVIGIVESWTNEKIFDEEITLKGYNLIRKDRVNINKSKGGGIVVYIKDCIKYYDITDKYSSNIDHVWVKILTKATNSVNMGFFYRPQDTNEEDFKFLVRNISKNKTENTIIFGDFNYRDINWRNFTSGSAGKKFLKEVKDIALHQCIKEATRGENILDLVLVYDKSIIQKVEVMSPIGKSDHNTLKINLNRRIKSKEKIIKCYRYNKANYNVLKELISKTDWENMSKNKSVNDIWLFIKTLLQDFRDKNIPWFKKNVRKDVPWINKKIKKLIRRRNNLFKKYKKLGTSYLKVKYIIARNLVTKEIKTAKRKYETKIIKGSKNNRKVFYAYCNGKNNKKKTQMIGPLKNKGGNVVVEDKEGAELLNEYFASVFNKPNIKEELLGSSVSSGREIILIDNIKVTGDEVLKELSDLKKNKSPGVDEINSTYLLEIKELIAEPLKKLFNKSIEMGIVPEDWKLANVTPLFKTGDKSKVENYRPVSLTCILGKILEKIIKKHIERVMVENKSIQGSQHGFSQGKSCLSNLLIFQDSIVKMLDKRKPVDIIYLDLQKAFDKVPHNILISKIINMGIRGNVVNWIKEWLNSRKQRVVINETNSDWVMVDSGVPQGSVLGPLLFNIFINDLDGNLKNSIIKFADDSKLWGSVSTEDEINNMKDDLETLNKWSELNQMPFNVKKCKVMHLGTNNPKECYFLSGSKIPVAKEEKDLGVFVNDKFKPSLNCKKVSKSAGKTIGLIKRNIVNKDKEGMMILYKTLVRPKIDYCIQAWRPYRRKDINILEKIQKRFTKIVKGLKDVKYEQRLEKLGITTIEDRHYRADMVQVFKILKINKDTFPENFLELNNRVGRINSMKLFKKDCKLDLCKYSFTFRVVDQWNKLPDAVVLSKDVSDFKASLDCLMGETRRLQ